MNLLPTIYAVAEAIDQDIPLWVKIGGAGVLAWLLLQREWKRMDSAAKREEDRIKSQDDREAARIRAQDEREATRLAAQDARLDRWEKNQERIFEALKSIVNALHDLTMTQPEALKNLRAEAAENLEQRPRK